MKTCQVEVWVIVDSNENYAAGATAEQAAEMYQQDIGDFTDVDGVRRVKVTLTVPVPVVAELTGVVSAMGEPSELVAS